MTDAFRELHDPAPPVAPDPAFARRLRARLERALTRPRGVVPMTETETVTGPRPAAVPYLAVRDARAAIDWYVDVFDAEVDGEPIVMPDGSIGHAELRLAGGVLYLAEQAPELGVVAPRPGEAAVSLMLPVADADRVRGRAIDAGADGSRPPYDGYGARHAWITDPFGHRWGLHSPLVDRTAVAYRTGDVTRVTHLGPDVERSRAFYAAVLGWTYLPDGRVDGATPPVDFEAGDEVRLVANYAVTDLDAARAAVTAAGGQARDAGMWTDSEGTPFRLQLVPDVSDLADAAGPPPPANGYGPGDLGYLTLHVGDSAAARDFYGAVLGWTFTPGRIADGWAVGGIAPMTGLAGGQARATGVAQWLVADIRAAVAAVRAHGGTATDPVPEPYGLSAECVDDQGLPFYLGEN